MWIVICLAVGVVKARKKIESNQYGNITRNMTAWLCKPNNKPLIIKTQKPDRWFGYRKRSQYFDAAVSVLSHNLGSEYINFETVTTILTTSAHAVLLAAIAKEDSTLLGACLSSIASEDKCRELDSVIRAVSDVPNLTGTSKVGLLQSIAVNKNFRRMGVGSQLTIDALKYFKKWKCGSAIAIAWIPSDGRGDSRGMLKGAGFREIMIIHNFWEESSKKDNFRCPACGNPPCRCDAAIMFLDLL